MIVDKVRDVTTAESPVEYELTIRVWGEDLKTEVSDLKFAELARKAVNGIAAYPIRREVTCNCSKVNVPGKPEKHNKNCVRGISLIKAV